MARLDVRRLKARARVRFVLELQSDYMRDLPTVVVAPLIPVDELNPYPGINPVVDVDGRSFAIRLEQIAGVQETNLGGLVSNLSEREFEIATAMNRLLFYV